MPFITISKPAVGDPTKKTFADEVVDDLTFLNSQLSAKEGSVINPSMETDADGDGNPDGWVFTDRPNGSHAIDTTNNAHGANGIKFTSTVLADGGSYGDSKDYYAVAEGEVYTWKAWRKASAANISCQHLVTWYTGAKALISTSTLFQDTNAPTTNTLATGTVTAPSTARFAKLRVEGGIPGVGSATGDITFDGLGFDTIYPGTVRPEAFEDHVTGSYDVAPRLVGAASHGNSWVKFGEWYMDRDGTIKTELGLRRGDAKASGTGYIRIYKNGSAFGTQRSTTSTTNVYWEQDLAFVKGDKIQVYVKENYSVGAANFSCGLFSGKQYARMGAHKDYPVGAI